MMQNKFIKKGFAILLLLAVWQIGYGKVDNEVLLSSPLQVGKTLAADIKDGAFWQTIFFSLGRISKGFLLDFLLGFLAGVVSFGCGFLKMCLEPFIGVIKSIPVASFVVLLLIWTGSEKLSVWISFLVVLPGIYESTIAGFESTDKELLRLSTVYDVNPYYKWFYVYRPAVLPYLITASRVAAGMAWKSVVAAELIGTPENSIGERLYMSKIMIDTASVLSWTIVVIVFSTIFEKIWIVILKFWERQSSTIILPVKKRKHKAGFSSIITRGIYLNFGDKAVFKNYGMELENHRITALMGESGIGKTTFLNIICGLQQPDSGQIIPTQSPVYSYVFQKDTFCENADAIHNCIFLSGNNGEVRQELEKILPPEVIDLPVKELSGGMRRRVSIAAAMCSDSDVILMDEPFNGLDSENKEKTALYIRENLHGRMLVFTTHNRQDIDLMQADFVKKII